jgi:RraA family protein
MQRTAQAVIGLTPAKRGSAKGPKRAPDTSRDAKKPRSAEMTPGPGFRIRADIARPPVKVWQAFAGYETADISDMMNRLYTFDPAIRNVSNELPLVGPALCVKVFPGDNLMVHKALDLATPGDILVIDTSQSGQNAVLGDLIANKAKHRGIAGVVVDGLIRDLEGVRETGLPVYARGVTAFGPLHRGPGEINHPISCGGVVVYPGDIIAADESGIVVVPADYAEELLVRLDAHKAALASYVANVKRGIFSNAWVDAQLQKEKCRFE